MHGKADETDKGFAREFSWGIKKNGGRQGGCVCRDHGADLRPRTEGRKKDRLQCFAQEATAR